MGMWVWWFWGGMHYWFGMGMWGVGIVVWGNTMGNIWGVGGLDGGGGILGGGVISGGCRTLVIG